MYKNKKLSTIRCKLCSKEEIQRGSNHKYCSICFKIKRKELKNIYNLNYYYRNREKINKKRRTKLERKKYRVWEKNYECKPQTKSVRVNYYKKNRDEILNKKRQLYPLIKDLKREYFKKYRKTDRGKEVLRSHYLLKNRRKLRIFESFSQEEWNTKKKRTKGMCFMCENFVGLENLHLDHIIPISKAPRGFIYFIDDVQPLCKSCNSSKKDRILEVKN